MMGEEVEEIRRRHPVEQVIGGYIPLRRSGRHLVGHCPFHNDTHPSLVVYPDSASWYCFGCQAGGDVFDFIMRIEKVTFPQALALLRGGQLRRKYTPPPPPEPVDRVTLNEEHLAVLTLASDIYHAALNGHPEVLDYLTSRGIDEEAIERHRLGYASGRDLSHLERKLREKARDIGLIGPRGEFFRNRVVIPEIRSGQVVYLVGRALGRSSAKYLHLPGLPKPIYGLENIDGKAEVFVTEGPFDWMTLVSWGYAACALLGNRLKAEHQGYFDQAKRIYLCLDNDAEGRKATEQLCELWGARARPVRLRGAKDINELGQHPWGKECFGRLVKLADWRAWKGVRTWIGSS